MPDVKDNKRALLILLAFITGGAVPIQIVTLSFGYAQYVKQVSLGPKVIMTAHEFAKFYIPLVYIPALILLVAVTFYCRRRYPDLFRRIVIGLGMGAIATVSLDFFRQMGVINGWLPGDTPVMFGKMATGSGSFNIFYPAGIFIHFMNGANFGLFYAFVWGKRKSYASAVAWATLWLVLVEIGMMTLPPMAPMVGMFGYNFAWPQLFLLTLAAHIAFGVTLGILVQHFLKEEDRGEFFDFLKGSA
ncbi:MAG: hypothetical protein IEMM0002_1347 [bacterium]|nr:MAG: hypothetical protein IEMM0002_1347 [bacterium]